jgi:hypothetical protein
MWMTGNTFYIVRGSDDNMLRVNEWNVMEWRQMIRLIREGGPLCLYTSPKGMKVSIREDKPLPECPFGDLSLAVANDVIN